MIAVVDTGGANIASIVNAFARLERESKLTRDPEEIIRASHVILPGVGAAGIAMTQIHETGLASVITSLKQPVLGICLGMQLLFRHSTEGSVDCLGLLDADVTKLDTKLPKNPRLRLRFNETDATTTKACITELSKIFKTTEVTVSRVDTMARLRSNNGLNGNIVGNVKDETFQNHLISIRIMQKHGKSYDFGQNVAKTM